MSDNSECTCPECGRWYAAEDIDRMVRELDVAMNGEGGATHPRLCDIFRQLKDRVSARHNNKSPCTDGEVAEVEAVAAFLKARDEALGPVGSEHTDEERHVSARAILALRSESEIDGLVAREPARIIAEARDVANWIERTKPQGLLYDSAMPTLREAADLLTSISAERDRLEFENRNNLAGWAIDIAALRIAVSRAECAEAERDALKRAGDEFLGVVLTCRRENTGEWMAGLAEDINAFAEAMGDPDRVEFNGRGWRIIRASELHATLSGDRS